MKNSFVHLHTHTHYSLLKSSCTVKGLVAKCVEYSQPAVAITDYGNMFGALDLYFSARSKGIKPLLGLEIYLLDGVPVRNVVGRGGSLCSSIVLLAQNVEGYRHLCRINTTAFLEGFYYVPRVSYNTLKKHNAHIIALTGGLNSDVAQTYLKKGADQALALIKRLKDIYSDRLYLQLNNNDVSEWDEVNAFLKEAHRITGVSLVAGGDVHYLNQRDHVVQDVLMCIGANRTLRDPDRLKLPSREFYFKSSQQMRELFQDTPEACDTTLEISERCHINFHLKKDGRPVYHLPRLQLAGEGAETQKLKSLSQQGLEKRLATLLVKGHELASDVRTKYQQRLAEELKIIINMGFTGYFLIVYDFVHWARERGIPVGPGRGSGASSLVAYCLQITDLDPMPHRLLFERFLNPARISLPDFDVDFCQENRNKVIEYVSQKYGKDYVAQVITYGRLQARAAVRDVGRVLGMSYPEVDQIAKLIPDRLGIKLEEAIKDSARLRALMETDPRVANLMQLACCIEGLIRHVSIHAAGVIIADHPIVNYAPLYRGAEGENVIQCDLNHAKKIGLVKFDFLGLKTLTQIHGTFDMIKYTTGKRLSAQSISLEDDGIYKVMRQGNTKGVFQFEGDGITDLIVKAKPSCFEDIVAINALFRPGPMDMIPSYLKRKKGKVRVEYLFPELEPILKETYGVIVYQEQVLLIAAKIAGYSYGEADILRRAMGEKTPSVMKKQKSRFLSGAQKNNYGLKKAEKLFNLMAEFANYGFNKSHAVAYCVLAAQTAWLKYYYPVEFFASLLTTETNNTDKLVQYVRAARGQGIKVLPPHVNYSDNFFIVKDRQIYFSLEAIKGVGKTVVEDIVAIRKSLEGKRFISVRQFFETVDLKKVNKKTIEALVKAGALDGLSMNRKEILDNYESVLSQVERQKEDQLSGQMNLFAENTAGKSPVSQKDKSFMFSPCADWLMPEKLENERSVIGFYLSGHPMDYLDSFRSYYGCIALNKLANRENKSMVCVWGMVSEFREIKTRKGLPMAFVRLEDNTGAVELVIFSDIYLKHGQRMLFGESKGAGGVKGEAKGMPILVKGVLQKDSRSVRVIMHTWEYVKTHLHKKTISKGDTVHV